MPFDVQHRLAVRRRRIVFQVVGDLGLQRLQLLGIFPGARQQSGGVRAVIISFGISLIAHFLVGALKSLITIRSWWASGLEMTWIGVIVAVVTYGLGLAFGALG